MTSAKKPKFSRILLKLSGESLGDANGTGISPEAVQHMAEQICEVRELGVQVVVVSGGLWKRKYGSDPNLIGKSISIANLPYAVIGVTGPDFHTDPATDL